VRAGTLPGLVAEDASQRIAGWTFFLRHGHTLQIGALAASSADVTEALLDAVLASSLAEDATSVVFFGFSTAPASRRCSRRAAAMSSDISISNGPRRASTRTCWQRPGATASATP